MATAPAGIAEDVDVGSPDGQTLENVAVAVGAAHIVLAASLNADGVADLLHHVLVKDAAIILKEETAQRHHIEIKMQEPGTDKVFTILGFGVL